MRRALSVLAFAVMAASLIGQYTARALFATTTPGIVIQVAAVALMVAARRTFGRRSFHAAANPTAGGIVTTGPYAYVRHPIYAAVLYFSWTGALTHLSVAGIACAAAITAGAIARMLLEERMLLERYPEYAAYMARVKRVVPFVL